MNHPPQPYRLPRTRHPLRNALLRALAGTIFLALAVTIGLCTA